MKHFFLLLLLLASEVMLAYLPVYSLTRDRRRIGYRDVIVEPLWIPEVGWAHQITCSSPGLSGCRAPSNSFNNAGEEQIILELVDYADREFERGNLTGSFQRRVKAENETFERIYMLNWNFDSEGMGKIEVTLDKL